MSARFVAWVNASIHAGKKAPRRPQDLLSLPWDEDHLKAIDMEELKRETEEATKRAQALWDKRKAKDK